MNNLVSVIVPVYNVEKYLDRCLNSILSQTYKNMEIILVDDGSKDSSSAICDKYGEQDNRIKVYHKENGGLSSARNFGIEKAKGDWLYFIDSDDWIDINTINTLINSALKNDCQIAMGSYIFCSSQKEFEKADVNKSIELYTPKEALSEMTSGLKYVFFAHNRLFKKDLFYDITFPLGKLFEDMYTIYKVIDKADKIVYNSEAKYAYFQRDDSITHNKFNSKQMDWYFALQEYKQFCLINYPELKEKLNNLIIFCCISLINKILISDEKLVCFKKEYTILCDEIKKDYKSYIISKVPGLSINLKYKVSVTLLLVSRMLYQRLLFKVSKK